jgi:hypothetical protein
VRDVSTEPCPSRTHRLGQQCIWIGAKPIIMSIGIKVSCLAHQFSLFAGHNSGLCQAVCSFEPTYTLHHCTLEIIRMYDMQSFE